MSIFVYKILSSSEPSLSFKDKVKTLHDVAKALDTIHKLDIIHKNLKPENIMISKAGEVITATLIDFGFACFNDEKCKIQAGTQLYMSPEILLKTEQTVDLDKYSFALIACEILTGTIPGLLERRSSESFYKTLEKRTKEDIVLDEAVLNRTFSKNTAKNIFKELIQGCLKKEAKDRLPDSTIISLLNQLSDEID